jgi:hypothetical protein
MGDMGDDFRALKDAKRAIKEKYGVPCPECVKKLPRAAPSILLPQQRCRIHGYRDPRPRGPEHSVWEEGAPHG